LDASPMLVGVIYPAYAWVGSRNRVYVASGVTDPGYSTLSKRAKITSSAPWRVVFSVRTQIYDPITDSWDSTDNAPDPAWVLPGAYVGDTFYTFGGEETDGWSVVYYDYTRKLNIPANSWSYGTSLPEPRAGLGAAEYSGKVYLAGGYNDCASSTCTVYSTVWEYDAATGTFSDRAPLPTTLAEGVLITSEPFAHIGLFYVPGYTSISGGAPDLSRTIYRYDPISDEWSVLGEYPSPARYQLGAVFMPDTSLWVIGGADASGDVYPLVSRCKLVGTACNWSTYDPPDLPVGRDALVAALADTTPPRPASFMIIYDTLKCRIVFHVDSVSARRRILVAGGSDGLEAQNRAWALVADTLDVSLYLSGYLTDTTYTLIRVDSTLPGFFPLITEDLDIPRDTSDTLEACLDSVKLRERETGFTYVLPITPSCIPCYPLGEVGELGTAEREATPQRPFILSGNVLKANTRLEIYSSDGRLVATLDGGSIVLRRGMYFIRSGAKVVRVSVR